MRQQGREGCNQRSSGHCCSLSSTIWREPRGFKAMRRSCRVPAGLSVCLLGGEGAAAPHLWGCIAASHPG